MATRQTDFDAINGFPERLRAAMKDRGYSHRGLAKAIGASKQSVTNWTQGRNDPSLRHLRNISQALDIPLVSLLEGRDSRQIEEGEATSLVREFAMQDIGPAIQALGDAAPDLLGLLSRAESYVKGQEQTRGES